MQTYETTARVEEKGFVHVAGVPFEPGTAVEVIITAADGGDMTLGAAPERTARLLTALDKGRNIEPVGPLRRNDLYDRDVLR